MSLYLARFFHRPPGDDDRKLLLILTGHDGEDLVMTIAMDGTGSELARRECASAFDAIVVFRAEAERLRAEGYVETEQTKYALSVLPPDPQPKPVWQALLDELMLEHLSRVPDEQTMLIDVLAASPARDEPLFLWLAASHRFATAPGDRAAASALAEAARAAFAARWATRDRSHGAAAPFYAWSLFPTFLDGAIHELLCEIHLAAGDPQAALAAIEHACDVALDGRRGARHAWLLCTHFPARQDEAFDDAQRLLGLAEYDPIRALPAYAGYRLRLQLAAKSDPGWRWGGRGVRAGEDALGAAERRLGATLPSDYRAFLATDGRVELLARIADGHGSKLRFTTAAELAEQRANLLDFVTMTRDQAAAEAHFRESHGVSLRALVPVAQPVSLSRLIVIHLEPGERFGWCYRWDHDDRWELTNAAPSFAAALAAITDGIAGRERETLEFLGIYVD